MSESARDWTITRHRLHDDLVATAFLWVLFAIFVYVVTLSVSVFRPIEISGWETGSQLARWYAGALGVYLTAVYLPLYIAHGYTRREFARQAPVAAAGSVLVLSALMTLGFGIERVIYGMAGWPQALQQAHLFTTPDAYGLVFTEFVLLFTVWTAAGAFTGSAFYRNPALGFLALPVALAMVASAELVLSPGFFEVVTAFFGSFGLEGQGASVRSAAAVTGTSALLASALTWWVIRDLPVRSKPT